VTDNEDSFTKQQFDIIQQIMHHTQQQIATSTAAKNSITKNSPNIKNWNSQQVSNNINNPGNTAIVRILVT